MTRQDDEGGVFQIVEAILVAVLVAGALIFFALVQKPPAGTSGEGQDLAILASDVLDVTGSSHNDWADDPCPGSPTNPLENYLPSGVLYILYIDDGIAPRCPFGTNAGGLQPRNAQGAAAYALDGTQVRLLELVVWTGA